MEGTHPLKIWRVGCGLTQEAASKRFGISEPTLSRLENRRRTPSLALAAKLSDETGIPMDKFVVQAEAAE